MMKFRNLFIYTIFWLLFSFTSFAEDYEITGEAHIEETEGSYIISIEIQSNLPEGTILEFEVYYAKEYFVLPTLRDPNEPEFNIEYVQLAGETGSITKGTCTIKTGNYKRRPYVGKYLVKIVFNPNAQPGEIRQHLASSAEPIEKEISFTYGKPEELEKQKREIRREIYEVMEQIKELHQALVQKVSEQTKQGKFNQDEWKEWSDGWKETLEEIKQDNESRREGWIYRTETVGKHSIEGLYVELMELVKQYENKAKSSSAQGGNLQTLESEFASLSHEFKTYFELELQRLGFGTIPNKPVVKSILSEIEKHLGLIDDLYEQTCVTADRKEWQEKVPEHQDIIQKELFKLANETSDYIFATYIVPFTTDFIEYGNECAQRIEGKGQKEKINQLFNRLKKTLNEIKEALELE